MARKVDKEGTQKRKEQILKAAGECFSENGFHQSSMADICKRAKLSPGTVYHYFRSKDEMILHFAQLEMDEAQKFAEALGQVNSIQELVELAVDSILGSDDHEELQFYLEVLTEGGRNPKVGKVLMKADEVVYEALLKQLKRLRASEVSAKHKMLALYVVTQLGALEIFKLEKPSSKECRVVSKLSKKGLLNILTERL